jgi:hypothetical protein
MSQHFGELKKFPNRASAPGGGGMYEMIPSANR